MKDLILKMFLQLFLLFTWWPIVLHSFCYFDVVPFSPLTSQDLIASVYKFSYKLVRGIVLDQDNNFYLISLSFLSTCLLDDVLIL